MQLINSANRDTSRLLNDLSEKKDPLKHFITIKNQYKSILKSNYIYNPKN